jgi:lipase chaperone LimK
MTTEEIEKRLEQIKNMAGDDESAHGAEDDLYREFIAYVASLDSLPSLSAKAKLILTTKDINFARWCA